MTCDPVPGPGSAADPGSLADPGPLAYTGFGHLGLLAMVAIGCLVVGGLVLFLSSRRHRRRGRSVTAALLVALSGAALFFSTEPPAQASAPDCPPADSPLSVTQTSVIVGLAPGASITFAGASIGFSNNAVNQDSCKGATVHLLYTVNPR